MNFSLPLRLPLRRTRTSIGKRYRRIYRFVRQVLEFALCVAFLPVFLIVMAAIAVAIRLESPGPAIFVQTRIGKGGHRFSMFKFRTMRHDYDPGADREFMKAYVAGRPSRNGSNAGEEHLNKPEHKAHITRVGRILRKTSLDELPQIINVLRGEMSLIGPRPNVTYEVEAYQGWHQERLEVLPGITGLAQVRGRSSLAFNSIVRYDIEYVRKQSPKLDLQILWWTVLQVLSRRGAG